MEKDVRPVWLIVSVMGCCWAWLYIGLGLNWTLGGVVKEFVGVPKIEFLEFGIDQATPAGSGSHPNPYKARSRSSISTASYIRVKRSTSV